MSRRLRSQILSCHRCELGDYSDSQEWHRVPWIGSPGVDVAIIGEAPGKHEALTGEPFVGRAGKVLDQALGVAGLSRDQVWIMNVICCRPARNDFAAAQAVGAVEACRPWFNAQLDASRAWLIILCGKSAYQAVMDDPSALHKVRGKFQWMDGRLWLPTWHSAYVLRQGGQSKVSEEFFADWRGVGQVLSGEANPPSPSIGGQLSTHFPEEKLRDQIDRKGWVRIYSKVLEDHMVIVDGKKGPKIPAAWADEPRWTTEELMRIGFDGRLRVSEEDLRKINLAKRVLGAEVIV